MLFVASYTTAQTPVVNFFYPVSAKANDTIQISGQFFSTTIDSNAVQFGVVSGKVISATSTQLRVIVPMSASNAPITVTTRNRSAQSTVFFQPVYSSNNQPMETRSLSPKKVFLRPMIEYAGLIGADITVAHDLNGDGKPELIASLKDSSRITILTNASSNGNLAFADTLVLPSGLSVSDIQVADLDGDNRPDIIVANNNHNTITILKNQTTGNKLSFANPSTIVLPIPVVPGPNNKPAILIRVADLNKDGLPDIFTIFSSGNICYALINNTSGIGISFKTNPIGYRLDALYISDLLFRDLNEDNEPELTLLDGSSFGPSFSVFKIQRKAGDSLAFTKVFTTTLAQYSLSMRLGHFNNDQKPDIAIAAVQPNDLRLYTNTSTAGEISFSLANRDTTVSGYALTTGDLNSNGRDEVVLNKTTSPTGLRIIEYLPTDSTLKLSNNATIIDDQFLTSLNSLHIADLNFDGRPDIFGYAFRDEGATINVLINEHTEFPVIKAFYPKIANYGDTITITGYNLSKVTKVHFQDSAALSFSIVSDSQIKAIVGKAEPGFVYVSTEKRKDSLAGFSIIRPIITEITPDNGRIGEIININGQYFDTSITNTFVHFGAVRAQVVSATSTNIKVVVPPSATAGPITVTSKSKSVVSAQHFTLNATNKGYGIQKNSLSAVWIDSTRVTPTYYTKTISHDLDGDGKPEILAIIKDSSLIRVFRNESTSSSLNFKVAYNIITGKAPVDLIAGDLNYDGKPEVIVTYGDITSPNISIYKNISSTGNIQLDSRKDYLFDNKTDLVPNNLYELALGLGDFNSDGRMDIVASNGRGNVFSILPNLSNDTSIVFGKGIGFDYRNLYSFNGSGPNSVTVTDINQDGKPDLVLSNPIKTAVIFINNTIGKLSFNKPIDLDGIGSNIVSNKNITVADVDRDGKKDIFATHDGYLIYYKNISTRDSVKFNTYAKLSERKWTSAIITQLSGNTNPDILALKDNIPLDTVPHVVFNNRSLFPPSLVYQTQELSSLPWVVKLLNSSAQDLNGDGKNDILGLNGAQVYALQNRIDQIPTIHSFYPASAGYGDTVQIRGVNFYGVTAVKFKDSAAKSFSIVSDTLITAIVGAGQSGVVTLINNNGMDTLGGFIFKKPEISFTPASGLTFTALQGTATKSQFYLVSAKNLQGPIQVTAPRFFEVSRDPNSGFSQSVNLFSARSTMIGDTVFVRFKTDSSATQFMDSIQHSSTGSAVFKYRVLANICDPVIQFKPFINTVSTDSSLVCFKQDTLTLAVTNGSGYNTYRWSTGDTTATIRITNSRDVTVRVGSRPVCLSEVSPLVRFTKNTNTKPSLGMVGDTSLVSTTAPHYRWYFNNKATNDTGVSISAKRVGFYRVETSNDKLCWDASNDFAVVVAANSMASDSVAVKIFPNPASGGFFNVVATLERVTSVIARVTVTDANGVVLVQTNKFLFFGREIKIPVTVATYKGTAFVRIELNGKVETKTIVLL
jgi:hypothetical protein